MSACSGDEEALLRGLQGQVRIEYDRGKYIDALRIAEEIYTIDAVRLASSR